MKNSKLKKRKVISLSMNDEDMEKLNILKQRYKISPNWRDSTLIKYIIWGLANEKN